MFIKGTVPSIAVQKQNRWGSINITTILTKTDFLKIHVLEGGRKMKKVKNPSVPYQLTYRKLIRSPTHPSIKDFTEH